MSKILITGGFGFVGSNIAKKGIQLGHDIIIVDNLSRTGSEKNFNDLKKINEFEYYIKDTRNYNDISNIIKAKKPDFIFHLAGQVAMTTSISDPRNDFETNVLGTINVLESVREYCPSCSILYSSSNKVYGDLEYLDYLENDSRYVCKKYPKGFTENLTLDFHSPYGCSKGAADQYLLDYYRIFGIKTVVFRHSTMYGGMQNSNEDQGWIGWFISMAKKTKLDKSHTFTISGNGKQVRDLLYVDDVTNLYYKCIDKIDNVKGKAFNIGGGFDQSLSLLELFDLLNKKLNVNLNFTQKNWRQSDQKIFISDNVKIKKAIDWEPIVTYNEGIDKLINLD